MGSIATLILITDKVVFRGELFEDVTPLYFLEISDETQQRLS